MHVYFYLNFLSKHKQYSWTFGSIAIAQRNLNTLFKTYIPYVYTWLHA